MLYVTIYVMLKAGGFPTIFYCHYPDLLLSTSRTFLKKIYRAPLDYMEEVTTGAANVVLVNSFFTKGVFRDTFTRLGHLSPQVLYPSLAMHMFDGKGSRPSDVDDEPNITTFLSINRYERKKNIAFAIRAFAKVERNSARLIVAGGYDSRVEENVQHFDELVNLAEDLDVIDKVIFLRSPSDHEKVWLLKNSSCLIYTPAGEHFGIVPLKACIAKPRFLLLTVEDQGKQLFMIKQVGCV